MPLQKFEIASLATLDQGRLAEVFERELHALEQDLRDRPGVSGKRQLMLIVELEPNVSENGELGSVDTSFEVKTKKPALKSAKYNMSAGRGGLLYREDSPDDVRQRTLADAQASSPRATGEPGSEEAEGERHVG